MNRFVLLLSLLFWVQTISAQSIERFVIGANGMDVSTANMQLSFTVGEIAVETVEEPNLVLNQGFHQTNPPYNVSIEPALLNLDYRLYPNPTQGISILELDNPDLLRLQIDVWDIRGRQIHLPIREVQNNHRVEIELDLSQQAPGLYLVAIQSTEQPALKTLKLEKL